jgi:N-acetylglucosaminyldiphosphoundecaprenol N-acetyl-beta-D-mannosaminyltransferase
VEHVVQCLAAGRGGWIATANLDHLRRLREPGAFRDAYEHASIVVADGMPLVWACRVQGTPLPERVAGSDLIYSLAAGAAAAGCRIFLLGGDPGTAEAAAARLRAISPGLDVAGTLCPPFGFEQDAEQMAKLQQVLVAAAPRLVFVALGSPKQELLIARLRELLPSAWWIGVGISFSFVAGTVKRAPRWVQLLGMEWLHRMLQEPRRLATRYLWHGPPFLVRLFAGALVRRMRPGSRAKRR